jgi:hypothetical protein
VILEVAVLDVRPGQREAFQADFATSTTRIRWCSTTPEIPTHKVGFRA